MDIGSALRNTQNLRRKSPSHLAKISCYGRRLPFHCNAVGFPLQCRCLSIAKPLPFHWKAVAFPLQSRLGMK